MAKKLIVLSDGTGNSAAKLFKTNVWKLYEAIDLTVSSDQIALYDDGVGTSRFKPWALLAGAFGFGLKRNVLKLYIFLSRHFHNEVNAQVHSAEESLPQIYAFGFSRGAFTVRVVAGVVHRMGFIPLASEAEMRRTALLSYREYRKQCFNTKYGLERPFRAVRDMVVGRWDRLLGRPDYDVSKNDMRVSIAFMGVWDTVAAYGMPIEELRVAIDKLIFPMTFATTKLLARVACARQCLSIDEERSSFAPVLWDFDPKRDLKQVWFAGMHANVGGGYPDDSLSSLPLAWMAMEAEAQGLCFLPSALADLRGRATAFGKMYDSRAGLGAFYRYQPRTIRCDTTQGDIPIVHESVVFRMATGFQSYAPIALPQHVRVVDKSGTVYDFSGFRATAPQRLAPKTVASPAPAQGLSLASMVALLKTPNPAEARLVEAGVLRRRFAYFGTLLPVLALLAYPLVGAMLPVQPWPDPEWIKGAADPLAEGPLKHIAGWVGSVTPGYLSPWLNAFGSRPMLSFVLAVVAAFSLWRNRVLSRVIADRAQAAWNIGKRSAPAGEASLLDRIVLWLMHSATANALWTLVSRKAFPLVVLSGFAVAVAIVVDRTAFWVNSSLGRICKPTRASEHLIHVGAAPRTIEFNAVSRCQSTGLALQRSQKYQISIVLPPKGWADAGFDADLPGLDFAKMDWGRALIMHAGTPLRRHLTEPWFVPIARVGRYGSDEHVLQPADVVGPNRPRRQMQSIITPSSNGELFLFVNDAYSGLFPLSWVEPSASAVSGGWARHLYGNNKGTAQVTVRRIEDVRY